MKWLTEAAHLPIYAFNGIEHPPAHSTMGDLSIRTSLKRVCRLLRSRDQGFGEQLTIFAADAGGDRDAGSRMIESMLNPHPIEPNWEIFHGELVETDTRLPSGFTADSTSTPKRANGRPYAA